jgi:hypothetical protein
MGTIKISVRRKPLQGKFTDTFLESFPLPSKKIFIPRNFGILTACSQKLFVGLQMLITSIAHFYDVVTLVFDVGMSREQIDWCVRQPGVTVKPFKHGKYGSHIKYPGAWFKPHYIKSSPFKHTIWIDADAMVIGDLRELIDWAHPNALFTTDHTQLQDTTLNSPMLYSYLPIGKPYFHDIKPHLNTGVFVCHTKRDQHILDEWCYCVDQACQVKEIAEAIACWDQGACKWALHRNDLLYLITPDKKFNFPAKIRHFSYPATPAAVAHWMKSLKPDESCVILHWMGSPKPWNHWGDTIDLDVSLVK